MKPIGVLLCTIAALMGAFRGTKEQGSPENSKQELIELKNHWLQVENDPAALESILAEDFLHVVPVGIITKKRATQLYAPTSVKRAERPGIFEDLRVRIYGNIGIVNGLVVATTSQGTQRTLFSDVFAYRDGRWQAVNAQELPAAAPAH
jgi:hypothetical protein